MSSTKSILIEGWRGINHSYALVNQYQILSLLKLNAQLYHHDKKYFWEHWNKDSNANGFNDEENNLIDNLESDWENSAKPEICYRIVSPLAHCQFKAAKQYIFGTCEYQTITDVVPIATMQSIIDNKDEIIITPSHWSSIGFLNAGLSEDRIKVIPHGVSSTIFYPEKSDLVEQYRKAQGFNQENFVILSLGAMTVNKGMDKLLKAYSILKHHYPHIRLVLKDQSNLYGNGPTNVLKQLMQNDRINFSESILNSITLISGNLSLDMLRLLYSSAQCYVSPYRAEGFNLTPLEAAACGTPVVITEGGSTEGYADDSFSFKISSTLESSEDKKYLEPNLESLVCLLSDLIENKSNSINQEKSLNLIRSKHSWDYVTKKLYDFL